ncbi:MAG TPA: nuclease-related domain-containing protein [Solirubrobacteraceae bacterium]|nr:nuclease-related domain-containing protein [Solirubrobacteraceae bacterium]
MPMKVLRLRYPAICTGCSEPLAAGGRAWWDGEARAVTCLSCRPFDDAKPNTSGPHPASPHDPADDSSGPIETGQAGWSAAREHEKRRQRREQRIEKRWGSLAPVIRFLSNDPRSVQAWDKGFAGERRLGEMLERGVGDGAVVLHDRKVPRTRGNIDHVVVAASGVWVIDAKAYTGRVEQRDVGGLFKADKRLYVKGRDKTKLAESMGWQIAAVRAALGDLETPISAVVCFVAADWKLFTKPFQLGDTWVTWPSNLVEMIAAPGRLNSEQVQAVARCIARSLPPKAPAA